MTDQHILPMTGKKVPIKFTIEDDYGKEELFSFEVDAQVFSVLCQEAMRSGIKVEEYIIKTLLECMEENDGNCG